MSIRTENELSPREWAMFNNEKEMFDKQSVHTIRVKQLELEIQKLDVKWSSWLRIPLTIITLPVRILFVIPLTIYAATRQEVPEFYQRFFR